MLPSVVGERPIIRADAVRGYRSFTARPLVSLLQPWRKARTYTRGSAAGEEVARARFTAAEVQPMKVLLRLWLLPVLLVLAWPAGEAVAQGAAPAATPAAAPAKTEKLFSNEQLDQMMAPVALYPDSLLAQLFMACTYPSGVAEAAEWSAAHKDDKGDAAVAMVEDRNWDPAVKSLVAFPQVLAQLKDQPDWVQKVGDAFLAQPKDVMDSVQRLRAQAQKA